MKSPAGLEALSLSLRAFGSNRTVVAVVVVAVVVVVVAVAAVAVALGMVLVIDPNYHRGLE